MKKKKNILIGAGLIVVCIAIIIGIIFISNGQNATTYPVKEAVAFKLNYLEENPYSNLVFDEFDLKIADVDELYNIEISREKTEENKSLKENLDIMYNIIEKFFGKDMDKSFLTADLYVRGKESLRGIAYKDIPSLYEDEVYSNPTGGIILFGNNTKEGGYMVQIDSHLAGIWFSKFGLGDIYPASASLQYKMVHNYLSGKRQGDDVEINLKDGKVKLSEMETRVLEYLNNDFFIKVPENITFTIGNAKTIVNGEYEALSFVVRRCYKGIPFEYGNSSAMGSFIDDIGHDSGEIAYVTSDSPDTLLSLGQIQGTIVETASISKIISVDGAIKILSEKIGENSIYTMKGIELIYRRCEMSEERTDGVYETLKPVWKFITINQNDRKYTLFYVDVVTGEITERFEYYYE